MKCSHGRAGSEGTGPWRSLKTEQQGVHGGTDGRGRWCCEETRKCLASCVLSRNERRAVILKLIFDGWTVFMTMSLF